MMMTGGDMHVEMKSYQDIRLPGILWYACSVPTIRKFDTRTEQDEFYDHVQLY